jgi:hypothetical protein
MNGRDRGGFQGWVESERWIGFGTIEGIIGIRVLCAARLIEPVQLAEVMAFKRFGEMAQELKEIRRRLVGQLERDTHDRQVIRFHGGGPQAFLGFFSARDLALRAARSCASLSR